MTFKLELLAIAANIKSFHLNDILSGEIYINIFDGIWSDSWWLFSSWLDPKKGYIFLPYLKINVCCLAMFFFFFFFSTITFLKLIEFPFKHIWKVECENVLRTQFKICLKLKLSLYTLILSIRFYIS